MSHKFPALVLSAFMMGLSLTPLAYIGIGALGGFSAAFSVLAVPLSVCAMLLLLWRFLGRPRAQQATPAWLWVTEAAAWLVIGVFGLIVSGFTLFTPMERIGLFCVLLLVTSALSAPVVWWRPSALVACVLAWPSRLVLAGALLVTAATMLFTVIYVATPSRFL